MNSLFRKTLLLGLALSGAISMSAFGEDSPKPMACTQLKTNAYILGDVPLDVYQPELEPEKVIRVHRVQGRVNSLALYKVVGVRWRRSGPLYSLKLSEILEGTNQFFPESLTLDLYPSYRHAFLFGAGEKPESLFCF